MGSSFVSQLLNVIASRYGLVSMMIGLLVVYRARRSRRLAWLLFTLCCFAASIAKFQDEFVKQPPPLVFPLEQLRNAGRPLAIILLCCLLLLGFITQNGWRRLLTPQPLKYLILVQIVIFFKTLVYGDIGFAFLAVFTFGAVVLMLRIGPSRWLQDEQNFDLAVWSIAMVGVIFVTVNAYQALFDLHAITFVHGWFLGTTGNPHHAAVLLAATIPCFMFLIESRNEGSWVKACWMVGLILVMIALFLTGSRTGIIMGVVSILFFYRQRTGALLRLGIFVGVVLAVILPFLSQDGSGWGIPYTAATDKFLSGTNTREGVWLALWDQFINYPLFGVPLEGGRLGYGESSWLAAGANLGLLGFLPLVMFGLECLKMILQLNKLTHRKPIYFLQSTTVIAGLGSLLVGSFSEAFLLGNLTFSLLAVLMYLSLGKYLIEADSKENVYLYWQTLQNQAV
ncbi:O-antigen ligase family protein [Scytonema sp. PRP1]|uniref:O-antigen ligase family protein n=1 Tax=Scytonema sp. PRP1 TaxID=3120513 RepID=UPI002FD61EB7